MKLVQPWQAYLNKFQATNLKEKIEDAWKNYLKAAHVVDMLQQSPESPRGCITTKLG
jgi:hypothetical protein